MKKPDNKRNIDIYMNGIYYKTTTWAFSCEEAVERFIRVYYIDTEQTKVTARYQKKEGRNA